MRYEIHCYFNAELSPGEEVTCSPVEATIRQSDYKKIPIDDIELFHSTEFCIYDPSEDLQLISVKCAGHHQMISQSGSIPALVFTSNSLGAVSIKWDGCRPSELLLTLKNSGSKPIQFNALVKGVGIMKEK